MGTKSAPGEFDCYNVALPDEPMFTLLARDWSAPHMVNQWAYAREREILTGLAPESDLKVVAEARAVALAMAEWRIANAGSWRAPKA